MARHGEPGIYVCFHFLFREISAYRQINQVLNIVCGGCTSVKVSHLGVRSPLVYRGHIWCRSVTIFIGLTPGCTEAASVKRQHLVAA